MPKTFIANILSKWNVKFFFRNHPDFSFQFTDFLKIFSIFSLFQLSQPKNIYSVTSASPWKDAIVHKTHSKIVLQPLCSKFTQPVFHFSEIIFHSLHFTLNFSDYWYIQHVERDMWLCVAVGWCAYPSSLWTELDGFESHNFLICLSTQKKLLTDLF